MTKKYQAIARKYRPQTFAEVVAQGAVVQTLKNALKFDQVSHAYLFCGSRGVGKTTLARLFAKALNCQSLTSDCEPCNECPSCREIVSGQSLDVIEIDGASNRGIDDIRQINETIGYAPAQGKYKIYIIDEVHMLTKEAFNALLKTLEEPPEKAKFFFATTEAQKVLPTIVSRCQRFDLGRIGLNQITDKLKEIAVDLEREIAPDALHLIATFAEGSLRDAESILDQIFCFTQGPVSGAAVRQALGLVSEELFFALDQAFSEARAAAAFELVEKLFEMGKDLGHFLEQLIEHYRTLTLYKTMGERALAAETAQRYAPSAQHYTQAQCLHILQMLIESEAQFQKSAFQRVALESLLLRVVRSKNRIPVEVLVRRLSQLEEGLKGQDKIEPAISVPAPIKIEEAPIQAEPAPVILKPVPFEVDAPLPKPVEVAVAAQPPIKIEAAPLSKPVEVAAVAQPPIKIEAAPLSKPVEVAAVAQPPIKIETAPIEVAAAPLPKPVEVAAVAQRPIKIEAAPIEVAAAAQRHPSHYDTLMRFAAIELEGTLKTN